MAEYEITQTDTGKSLSVKAGDEIVLDLQELAAAGFEWKFLGLDEEIVACRDITPPSVSGVPLPISCMPFHVLRSRETRHNLYHQVIAELHHHHLHN